MRRRVLRAVEIRVVEAKRVCARHVQRAVGREYDAPLDASFDERLDAEQLPVVDAQLAARDALGAEIEHAPLGERLVPHVVVVVLDRPLARGFAFRRREIGEVHVAVRREIGVEHDVVKALRRDDLDGRHAGDRLRDRALRRHGAQHAAPLRDEEVAVGQERERPGTLELVRDDVDFVARLALRRRRVGLAAERGLRLALACLCCRDSGCKEQKRNDAARDHGRSPRSNDCA